MPKIAKKARSVKGQKKAKPSPPRFSIKKDSLGRRYAIEKRTGKRVAVVRAEKERKERRKTIPRNIAPKAPKRPKAVKKAPKRTREERSAAGKRGWETRRKKALVPIAQALGIPRPPPRPPSFIPPGLRMVPLEGIAERASRYPKVQAAADNAWYRLQAEAYARIVAKNEGRAVLPMATTRFDQEHGEGAAEHIRYEVFTRAHDLTDLDRIIEDFLEEYDDEYSAREIYTLYFSPDAA